jgi:hypothetical protein
VADGPELDLRKLQRKGTLQSLLDWAGRPGSATLDLLTGHVAGAGREAMDFLLGPARALTGDLIPELSGPEDARTLASVAGVTEPGLAKTGLDIANSALNPLTYVGFGKGKGVRFMGKTIAAEGKTVDPLTLIGKGANELIDKLPESAQDYVGRVKQGVKNTLGWHDLSNGELDLLSAGQAQRTNVSRAGLSQVNKIMKGLGAHEREAVFDVLNDLKHGGLDDKKRPIWTTLGGGDIAARLAAHPIAPEFKPRVAKALEDVQAYTKAQLEEGKTLGIFDQNAVGADDYIQRSYSGLSSEPEQKLLGGAPVVTKHRSLRSGEQLASFLNENPEVKIERDAAVALTRRAETQGRLAQQAELSKKLLEAEKLKPFSAHKVLGVAFTNLGDSKVRTGVETILNNMKLARPDMFHALGTALKGMPKRNVIEETLNFGNTTFKPAAIYGIGFPRIGAIIRNTIAFPFQAGAVEGLPASVAVTQAKNIPKVLLGALDDAVAKGLGSRVIKGAHLSADFDMIEKAFQQSGGVAANARVALTAAGRDDLNYALDNGVLDNFVSADKMLGSLRGSGLWRWAMTKVGLSRDRQQKIFDIAEMPADAFQGTEQRARLTMFRELTGPTHKMKPQEAARLVKESFYDYTSMHPHNRTLRTIIPFAAFATNAIRQQGKFLSRTPGAATVLGGLYGGGDNSQPMYPYMAGQAHVGIGRNDQGDPQYLSGFGLPMEALNQIPNLTGGNGGGELLRTVVGSTAPTIKTAASYTFNEDPFFQTPFGSFDKTPLLLQKAGAPAGGTFGRLYNELAGTGMIQPVTNIVDQVGRAIDPRLGAAAKVADLGFGARVTTVDENKAMQQILDRYLQSLPQVQKSTHLYQRSKDPETQAVLHQLEAAKKKINDRRKAEMAGEASSMPASQLRM